MEDVTSSRNDAPSRLHPETQRILQWSKRAQVGGGRDGEPLGVAELLVGFAARIEVEPVGLLVAASLGLDGAEAGSIKWPERVRQGLERAREAEAVTDRYPLEADLQEIVDSAYHDSKELAPEALIAAALASSHALVAELHFLNGSREAAPTPVLDSVGHDLTAAAREGRLGPVVGRDALVDLIGETLCRSVKRNPLLVGEAGVGKTAVAERLAQRIVAGEVPNQLIGSRLVQVQPSTLIARAGSLDEFIDCVDSIVREAGQPGIVLFVDEVHSMVGAGGAKGSTDMASLMKPALARGDIACIAATTDYEYRRHLVADPALERRFVTLRVQELTPGETIEVLSAVRNEMEQARGVGVDDAVLPWLVSFADRRMKNRRFPDKAIDLLDQCIAYAAANGLDAVTQREAEAVAHRLVAVPDNAEDAVTNLARRLMDDGLLCSADVDALAKRLHVTLGGFDVRSERPNAVVLLADQACDVADQLARTIADELLANEQHVLAIDFADFSGEYDVARLVGSAPGLVGYQDQRPIHTLLQMPWCVFLCRNVDLCHIRVRDFLRAALEKGVMQDGRGKNIHLSDTIVLLTARIGSEARHALGFVPGPDAEASATSEQDWSDIGRILGGHFLAQVDMIVSQVPDEAQRASGPSGRVEQLLWDLASRYRVRGLELSWDDSLLDWIAEQAVGKDVRQVERLIDDSISPVLVRKLVSLEGESDPTSISYRVAHSEGAVQLEELESADRVD